MEDIPSLINEITYTIHLEIDHITQQWNYQYPELKRFIEHIQNAIQAHRETKELDIPLPKDLLTNDSLLTKELVGSLKIISNRYSEDYNEASKQGKQQILEGCNQYFQEVLKNIDKRQEPINELVRSSQEGSSPAYEQKLQTLVNEELKKKTSTEILAKILSTLSEDNPHTKSIQQKEEDHKKYNEWLQEFVDIKVERKKTKQKLQEFTNTISLYEQKLQHVEAIKIREERNKLEGILKNLNLKYKKIQVKHQEALKPQIEKEYQNKVKLARNYKDLEKSEPNSQEYNNLVAQRSAMRREITEPYVKQWYRTWDEIMLIGIGGDKNRLKHLNNSAVLKEKILPKDEIGMVDPKILDTFNECISGPSNSGKGFFFGAPGIVLNIQQIFYLAKDKELYKSVKEGFESINRLGVTRAAALVTNYDAVNLLNKKQANFGDIACSDPGELENLREATFNPDFHYVEYSIRNIMPKTLRILIDKGKFGKEFNAQELERAHAIISNNVPSIQEQLEIIKHLSPRIGQHFDTSMLHIAVKNGNIEMIKLLANIKKVDINAKNTRGSNALHIAARNGNIEMARYLLEKGAHVDCEDSKNQPALFIAVIQGEISILSLLVERKWGGDINAKNTVGTTALHIAVKNGKIETVRYLRELGANGNAKDQDGQPPLFIAVKKSNIPMVTELLEPEWGLEVDAVDKDGRTALHIASEEIRGDTKIAELLMKKMGDINALDNKGRTALFQPATRNWGDDPKMVRTLLKHGIKVNLVDNNGRTVLDETRVNKHSIILILASYGAIFQGKRTGLSIILDNKLKDKLIKEFSVQVEECATIREKSYLLTKAILLCTDQKHGIDLQDDINDIITQLEKKRQELQPQGKFLLDDSSQLYQICVKSKPQDIATMINQTMKAGTESFVISQEDLTTEQIQDILANSPEKLLKIISQIEDGVKVDFDPSKEKSDSMNRGETAAFLKWVWNMNDSSPDLLEWRKVKQEIRNVVLSLNAQRIGSAMQDSMSIAIKDSSSRLPSHTQQNTGNRNI